MKNANVEGRYKKHPTDNTWVHMCDSMCVCGITLNAYTHSAVVAMRAMPTTDAAADRRRRLL